MTSNASKRFDDEAIARLRRFGGDTLLHEMIALFASGTPDRMAIVHDAAGRGDTGPARAALHALKSSAGQMGALALQSLCEEGEQVAGRGDLAGLVAMLPALDAEAAAAVERLEHVRTGERA